MEYEINIACKRKYIIIYYCNIKIGGSNFQVAYPNWEQPWLQNSADSHILKDETDKKIKL